MASRPSVQTSALRARSTSMRLLDGGQAHVRGQQRLLDRVQVGGLERAAAPRSRSPTSAFRMSRVRESPFLKRSEEYPS